MNDLNKNPNGAEMIGARQKVFGLNKKILPFALGGVGLAVLVIVTGIFSSDGGTAVEVKVPAQAGYQDKSAIKSEEDRKADAEHARDAVENMAVQDSKSGATWWSGYKPMAAPAPAVVAGVPDLSGAVAGASAPVAPLSGQVPALSAVNGKTAGGKPSAADVAAAKAVADKAAAMPVLPTGNTAAQAGGAIAQMSQADQERQQKESAARNAGLAIQIQTAGSANGGGMGQMNSGVGAAQAQLAALRGGAGATGTPDQMQQALNTLRTGAQQGGAVDDAMKKEAWGNRQGQKPEYLNEVKHAAVSDNIVAAGSVIPAVLISGVNSELPGQLIAQVRQDVYDSVNGKNLLIPKGTKLIGVYDSNVAFGQKRLLIAWSRLIYNDGQSFNLKGMPGADSAGLAGMSDQVDNHYGRIFGGALLMSMISAGAQLSQGQTATTAGGVMSASQTVSASLGQQLGQVGMAMVQKNMQIAPTLEIRQGFSFNVTVTADVALPPVKKI